MKKMSENEKKAKLTALRGAHSEATKAMKESMTKYQSSPELKKHKKDMSKETDLHLEDDLEGIEDPTHNGNVVGRHLSDEEIDGETQDTNPQSDYDIDELDARIAKLVAMKEKAKRG